MHIQQALNAIRQKGLQPTLEKAIKDKEECSQKLVKASEALANYKGRDENPPKNKTVQKSTEAAACTKETCKSLIAQVFQLYSNLLTEEARRPWSKILGEQIEVTLWTELFGVDHAKEQKWSWKSIMDCITFHLLLVFQSDAAKTQQFYISNGLKKPSHDKSGSSCRESSSLMVTWTYCPASSTLSQPSSPRRWNRLMMPT